MRWPDGTLPVPSIALGMMLQWFAVAPRSSVRTPFGLSEGSVEGEASGLFSPMSEQLWVADLVEHEGLVISH